jgi:hypothetical protein
MFVLFSQLSAFLCLIFPQLAVIQHSYYLGEFTGSKTCLLAIPKEEALCSVNFVD